MHVRGSVVKGKLGKQATADDTNGAIIVFTIQPTNN